MKQVYKPVLSIVLLLATLGQMSAQDPRFSQYYASPWNLNPAMTGLFNGRWRVTANYRDQWSSFLSPVPFRTYSAAVDARFEVGRHDFAAVGIGAMHDEAGTARFMQNKAQVGAAFLKQLSGGRYKAKHYLSAGGQLGFGQNSIDWGRLWFSRQYDPVAEAPDPTVSNGEPNADANTDMYVDFNAGLLWYVLFEEDGFIYLGGALHHINEPGISLVQDDQESLYSRWSAHAGGQIPLTTNFGVLPGALVMKQGPAFETDFGVNFRYSNNDLNELALRAGAWARLGNKLDQSLQMDAITVVGMVELNRWTFGLSYDITVSSLTDANNSRGAFEISLMYVHPGERRARIVCPNF
ncbi:MAG: PorP/SprF family type IX secretion system membrane protein [Lewinellaceae bacterium]|nr:PorP/SprF family type IX secretion system membrane protein [Saprospiraceae bacterium]MCB0543085.1 PorP/SprF family type IX secretion system membrane protein [Saprospiraceae bacterium]MCB9306804.1 PorP/SprF family type IX secretion system membrane protein [Lewinellaceae bacterium]MCB9354431.1 PorP/SprF family type IX secretion system membrane protein [Lewinellaceae bacterium]